MLLIPMIAILAMYLAYRHRNGRTFGPVSLVIAVYVAMGISAIVLRLLFEYPGVHPIQLEPMLFLAACLCISLWGLFSYRDQRHCILIIENPNLLRKLEGFQIVTSVGALIFFFPFAVRALSEDIGANRMDLVRIQEQLGSYGLINSFFSLVGNLFILSIILAFVNLATVGRGGSTRRAMLLLILSSVYIVYIFAYVGRDGLVYWSFSFLFLYLLFRDFLPGRDRRQVRRIGQLIALPAIIGFSLITDSRFADGDTSILSWLFIYAGSQVVNFNDIYLVNAPPTMGLVYFSQMMDLLDQLTGTKRLPFVREDWWATYTDYGVQPWTFPTFVGSMIQDFSRWGALILTVAIAVGTRASLRKQATTGILSFSNMLYFVLLSQIVLFGVFYYRQFGTLYTQIAIVLVALSFKLFPAEGRILVLEKNSPRRVSSASDLKMRSPSTTHGVVPRT